ncbi:MAG: hypothetical protein HY234_03395 [Acidobacteria bacterium]|nr:hypothetical protein [Acidobacteriota bacterium]
MKYKHPYLGTSSTILKLATQLVAKSVRPGESPRSIERKIERMVKFLEEKQGMIDMPASEIGVTITPEERKLFAPLFSSRQEKHRQKARKKERRVVPMKSR